MRTAGLVLLVLAAFAIFAVSASVDVVEVNERTEDRPGYVHTMSQPEEVMYDDAEQEYDSGLHYGPVKVWGVPLPEWAVTALKELGVNLPPREPLPVPHDAPISARAPVHLPYHYKGKVERLRQRSAQESKDFIEREWILIIKKAYRDDFVAVLEDMGKQLNERFGLQVSEWFDIRALRESKRAHQERQLQRRAEGQLEERPWQVNVDHELGHRAFEFGQRMMVMIAIPASLAEREVEILESLRDMPWIESIEANQVMRTMATITAQTLNQNSNLYPWGLDRVDQRSLPLNQRYTYPDPTYNVVVYVIDTGIRATHQEFGGRATFGRNFIIGDSINTDCNGHGTHVSGIVAGSTMGLSKRVTIVGLKVLDCSGSGTSLNVATAINWAVNDCSGRSSQPKCIISLSLGSQATTSGNGVESALQDAYNSGLVVVTAAGNSNLDACTVSPARSPYGITVAATTSRDAKASFSNYGACVDIWAPGVYIPSAYNTSDSAYQILSGTSQATPHVTGTAALYLGAIKNCTPSEVAGAIYASSTINQVTGTPSGTVNRLLYSLVDQADAPTTAAAACQRVQCTVTSSTLLALGSWNSDAFTVDSTTAQYGYFQVWLDSSADLDLQLQYHSGSSWTVLATSSGSSGEEWIQYSTSAQGAGQYRFYVTGANAAASGDFTVYYQVPGSSQAGSPKTAAASSISAPFWLLPLFRGLLG